MTMYNLGGVDMDLEKKIEWLVIFLLLGHAVVEFLYFLGVFIDSSKSYWYRGKIKEFHESFLEKRSQRSKDNLLTN